MSKISSYSRPLLGAHVFIILVTNVRTEQCSAGRKGTEAALRKPLRKKNSR